MLHTLDLCYIFLFPGLFSLILYVHEVGNMTSLFAIEVYLDCVLHICQSCRKLLLILL